MSEKTSPSCQVLAFLSCSLNETLHLDCVTGHSVSLASLLVHSHEPVCQPFFLKSTTEGNLLDTNSRILSICLSTNIPWTFPFFSCSNFGPMFYTSYKPLTFSPQSLVFQIIFYTTSALHIASLLPYGSWLFENSFYHQDLFFEPFPHPMNSVTAFPWFPCRSWNIALESFPSFFPLICTRG